MVSDWKKKVECPQCGALTFVKWTKEGKWMCLKSKCRYWMMEEKLFPDKPGK